MATRFKNQRSRDYIQSQRAELAKIETHLKAAEPVLINIDSLTAKVTELDQHYELSVYAQSWGAVCITAKIHIYHLKELKKYLKVFRETGWHVKSVDKNPPRYLNYNMRHEKFDLSRSGDSKTSIFFSIQSILMSGSTTSGVDKGGCHFEVIGEDTVTEIRRVPKYRIVCSPTNDAGAEPVQQEPAESVV